MWKPVKTTLCVTLWSSAAVIQPQRPFAGTFVDAAIGACQPDAVYIRKRLPLGHLHPRWIPPRITM